MDMSEKVSSTEIWQAYFDCKRRKRTSVACAEFEIREAIEVPRLWRDICEGTYEIGYSNAFVVTRPKYREVFAADFRDRIVHHYLMLKTLQLFEDNFIEDSYNCRKRKGVTFAVKRIQEQIRDISEGYTGECWILKCDLQGFFMSIDKSLLVELLESFLDKNYHGDDKDVIKDLTRKVVLHRPEVKCRRKGDISLWDKLDTDKSLFTIPDGKGMAIGNLTSQIYANFYMSFFDEWVLSHEGVGYGRYVDDFIIMSKSKKQLLWILSEARKWLKEHLLLRLHPKKFYLQHFSKGVSFVGYVIKKDRLYAGKRLVGNATNLIRSYNKKAGDAKFIEEHIEELAQRYNSFMGFLVHTRSYKIRSRLWDLLDDRIKRYVYLTGGKSVLKVRKRYKRKNKLIYELRKKRVRS